MTLSSQSACLHRNIYVPFPEPARCADCGKVMAGAVSALGYSPAACGWCKGEGALRDAEGKLGQDCPRCKGRGKL